jgi:phosphopantothenoylcysteine decarboxylase/phosphopantothenate--cysteine ligase
MWEHPAVADNIALLRRRGVHVVEPVAGRLAGGDVGAGRLAEPADIVAAAAAILGGAAPSPAGDLAGLRAVVTAGGTREPIDPVRYIGNRSSGKQGYAIAAELAGRGATVVLISTVPLAPPPGVELVPVETAAEMEAAVLASHEQADVVVMAAAVADFRPKEVVRQKIKKAAGAPDLVLEPTPDILAGLGARRRPGQILVGFAAETAGGDGATAGQLRRYARQKLESKGVDLVVANDVAAPGVGFAHDTNAVVIVGADGSETDVALSSKTEVATAVVDAIARFRIFRTQDNQERS